MFFVVVLEFPIEMGAEHDLGACWVRNVAHNSMLQLPRGCSGSTTFSYLRAIRCSVCAPWHETGTRTVLFLQMAHLYSPETVWYVGGGVYGMCGSYMRGNSDRGVRVVLAVVLDAGRLRILPKFRYGHGRHLLFSRKRP